MKSQSCLGEFDLIEKLFAPLAAKMPGAYGLKDDAAVLNIPATHDLVVTADALVEGVHFLRDDPPYAIAKKALRVNLSDLAAKGATPHSYLLMLALPDWVDDSWLQGFVSGLEADQENFGISLIGGDTTRTPGPLMIAITAHGIVPSGRVLRRGGARAGDIVFVTGTIGDAGAGLAVLRGEGIGLRKEKRERLIARYRLPEPRVALGPLLIGHATAALDVSDGLLADLAHIADVSGVRLVVEAERVPLSIPGRAFWGSKVAAIAKAASAGDDYEIAFTAPASSRRALAELSQTHELSIREIGRVEEGAGVTFLDDEGRFFAPDRLGFTHF